MSKIKFLLIAAILFIVPPSIAHAYTPQAAQIGTDVTNFTGNLTASETTVQKALDRLSGPNIIKVGTLTTGATGSGFTIAFGSSTLTGTVPIANGGTGASTQQTAINALTGTQSSGKYLRSDGANATLASIVAGDVPTLNQNTTGSSASATNITTTDDTTTNTSYYPTFQTATGGTNPLKTSSTKLTYNPSTGSLSSTTFIGALTGNASTVTTNANLTGVITSVGNATSIASQTGTGTKFVVDTSPTLITPALGTPTSGILTNCTWAAKAASGANTDITSLTPGTDFTINQNSVAPFTSVNAGAVANTLYMNAGSVGINTSSLTTGKLNITGTDKQAMIYTSNTKTNGDAYGGDFEATGANAANTNYGGFFSASGGLNNYGVYSNAGKNYFGGVVRMAAYGAGTATFDASGNITSVSDERLKDIQGEFKRGLSDILKINPILFKYNSKSGMETEHIYAGLSAQNVKESIPEAVKQNSEGFYSLDDRAIIAALINSDKTLHNEINYCIITIGGLFLIVLWLVIRRAKHE